MKSSRVTEAAHYVDALARLRRFREFYIAAPKGVQIVYGGVSMETTKCSNEELARLLETEERMIMNTLAMFGVEIEAEVPPKATRS